MIGFDLINENSTMLAAVPGQIALTVTINVEPPHQTPAWNRRLPNCGVDGPSLPGNVAGEPDIQRQQTRHHATSLARGWIKTTAIYHLTFSTPFYDRFRCV